MCIDNIEEAKLGHSIVLLDSYLTLLSHINTCRVRMGDGYVDMMFPHWNDLEMEFYNSVMHLLKDVDPALANLFDRMVFYEFYMNRKGEDNED